MEAIARTNATCPVLSGNMSKSGGMSKDGWNHPMSVTMQVFAWKKCSTIKGLTLGLGKTIESSGRMRIGGRGGAVFRRRSPRAFTEHQQTLVQEAWKALKPNAPQHGLNLFLKVFEIAPSAKKYFSFLSDTNVPLEKNPKLKAHALLVFTLTCEAAASLLSKDGVSTPGTSIKQMGHTHFTYGILDEHFDVVKYCVVQVLAEGLPKDMWTTEMKAAWGEAYDALANAIKSEMRKEKEETLTGTPSIR